MPAPLALRGMKSPLASVPDWKMTSPLETEDPGAEPWERSTKTPTVARAATASAAATIRRSLRRERATLEVAELLEVLVATDLAGGVAALEDFLG